LVASQILRTGNIRTRLLLPALIRIFANAEPASGSGV